MADSYRFRWKQMSKLQAARAAYAAGEGSYGEIARRFGISRDTARRFIRNKELGTPQWNSCKRKKRHATEAEAAAALDRMIADKGTERERGCEVYACQYCDGFHVGHPAAPEQETRDA